MGDFQRGRADKGTKGYWRIARRPVLHKTLDNTYWYHQGPISLYVRYTQLRPIESELPYMENRTEGGVRGQRFITSSCSIKLLGLSMRFYIHSP